MIWWISKLSYCVNPNGDGNDYLFFTLKDFVEPNFFDKHPKTKIQLLYNKNMKMPNFNTSRRGYEEYISSSSPEPEVDFEIIRSVEDVSYEGDFNFLVFAQSPNYTPEKTIY